MTLYRKNSLPHSSIRNLSSYSIYNQIYVPKYGKGGNFIGKAFKFVGRKIGQGLQQIGKKLSSGETSGGASKIGTTTQEGVDTAKKTSGGASKTGTTTQEGVDTAKETSGGTSKTGTTTQKGVDTAEETSKETTKVDKESIFRKGWNWYKKSWTNPWLNTGRLMYLNADLRSPDTKLYGLPDIAILHALFPSEGIDNMSHKYLGGGSSEQVQAEAGNPVEEIVISDDQLSEDQEWLDEFLKNYE